MFFRRETVNRLKSVMLEGVMPKSVMLRSVMLESVVLEGVMLEGVMLKGVMPKSAMLEGVMLRSVIKEREMKKFLALVVSGCALALSAADPGGVYGFVKAVFKTSGDLDTTSDIWANAQSRVDEIRSSRVAPKTTVAFGSYMKMEAGVTYEFKGNYSDIFIDESAVPVEFRHYSGYYDGYDVAVKVGDVWVFSSENGERTGTFTPPVSDWYKIELRVGNTDGNEIDCMAFWKTSTDLWAAWRNFDIQSESERFKIGVAAAGKFREMEIIRSQIRANDPTILDVVYKVYSEKPTVDVRALAFEDGERNFWKVVRPETFVKDADGNETASNIGDGIAANVEHTLSWKVSSDWKTDLAKVKFEILTREDGVLPLELITIPAVNGRSPEVTCSYNAQTDDDVLNAMYWYYADGADDLALDNGYLKTVGGEELVARAILGNKPACVRYVAEKMGYMALTGALLDFARTATRKTLNFNSQSQQIAQKPSDEFYVGDKAYCVIDVSGGTNAVTYPVTYLDKLPLAGWGDDYKTTKILLRRIESGTFMMGGSKPVTLTKPFYMGVFQVTQKQWELVMGNNPASCQGDMRPVERVSWNDVRGDSDTHNWPNVRSVAASSFMGRLQAKTGLVFDLPTEAQWEYACRAGTTSDYNNGGSSDSDLKVLGRYNGNQSDGKGGYTDAHTTVGSYLPNAWGLYDMHGNVFEWCLDWYAGLNSDPSSDPEGASSGSYRVQRGGSWSDYYYYARSSDRYRGNPSSRSVTTFCGFRLSMTLTNQ